MLWNAQPRQLSLKGPYEDMGKARLDEVFKEAGSTEPLIINFYCGYNLDLALSSEKAAGKHQANKPAQYRKVKPQINT